MSRAGEGRLINFGGQGAVERLVTPGTQSALEVIHSVIEPGGNGGEELYALTSEVECAYVLSGTIEVVLQHGPETLSSGDAMTFPGSSPAHVEEPRPRDLRGALDPGSRAMIHASPTGVDRLAPGRMPPALISQWLIEAGRLGDHRARRFGQPGLVVVVGGLLRHERRQACGHRSTTAGPGFRVRR